MASLRPNSEGLQILILRGATLVTKFALTVYIAQVIGLEALGFYGVISSAMLLAPVIFGLGIMQTVGRRAVRDAPSDLVAPITSYLIFTVGLYLLVMVLGWFWFTPIMIIGLFAIFLEHLNFEGYQLLISRNLIMRANITHFVRSALWVPVFVLSAQILPDLRTMTALFGFWIVGSLLALLITMIPLRGWPWGEASLNVRSNYLQLRDEVRQARFLYFGSVANTVSAQGDRFIIPALLGLELAGVYVFFRQAVSALVNLFNSAFVQPARPRLINALNEGIEYFADRYKRLSLLCLLGSALASVAAYVVLYFVVPFMNQELLVVYLPLFGLLLGFFILNILAEAQRLVLFSQREDKSILILSIFVMCVALVLNLALLPLFSIWGAGIAAVGAAFARSATSLYYIRKHNLLTVNQLSN